MKHNTRILLSLLTTTALWSNPLHIPEDNNITESKDWIVLPFAFSSDSTGIAGGIGIIKQGLLQSQTTLVMSVFGGMEEDIITNGQADTANFKGGFFAFSDYKLPFTNRFFFSLISLKSYFPKQKYYFEGDNNSDKDKGLSTSGESNFFNTTFEYILPIGEGLDNPEGLYKLQDGFTQDREGYGNGTPFITG